MNENNQYGNLSQPLTITLPYLSRTSYLIFHVRGNISALGFSELVLRVFLGGTRISVLNPLLLVYVVEIIILLFLVFMSVAIDRF